MIRYELSPWIWPPLVSAALIATVGAYIWRRRETPGALPLALLSFLVALWCVTGAAELAATELSDKQSWFAFRDFLALPGVILGLWFALAYAGLERFLTRPVVAILVGSVFAHIPFYFADGGLLWSRVWLDGSVRADLGPVGAVFNIWGYGLFLLSSTILVVLFIRSPAHRVPVVIILLGQLTLRVAYPLGTLNVINFTHIPPILVAFDFATLMYAIALFRFRILDVVPVAREAIIERMPDAVIALDSRSRIVDLNPAGERLLGTPRRRGLGQPLASASSSGATLAGLMSTQPAEGEVELGQDGACRCQVQATPLADWQGRTIGRLLTLHDITALRTAEERLLDHERTRAGTREREHMARELHDSIGQVLGYLSLQADAARKLLRDGRVSEADAQVARLADVAREAHADVRGYIDELHSAVTPASPFTATLQRYLDAFTHNFEIAAELAVDPSLGDDTLTPDEQSQLFRIVQEAMSNARRHGHARRLTVMLGREDSRIRLAVEDDGSGFDVTAFADSTDGRHGLRFMRERAEQLDAELAIESAPARGTRVVVSLPIRTVASSAAASGPPAPTARVPGTP